MGYTNHPLRAVSLPADRRERSGIDSPITRLASATGKGTVAIASSPGQSSLPQRGVGSAKVSQESRERCQFMRVS